MKRRSGMFGDSSVFTVFSTHFLHSKFGWMNTDLLCYLPYCHKQVVLQSIPSHWLWPNFLRCKSCFISCTDSRALGRCLLKAPCTRAWPCLYLRGPISICPHLQVQPTLSSHTTSYVTVSQAESAPQKPPNTKIQDFPSKLPTLFNISPNLCQQRLDIWRATTIVHSTGQPFCPFAQSGRSTLAVHIFALSRRFCVRHLIMLLAASFYRNFELLHPFQLFSLGRSRHSCQAGKWDKLPFHQF